MVKQVSSWTFCCTDVSGWCFFFSLSFFPLLLCLHQKPSSQTSRLSISRFPAFLRKSITSSFAPAAAVRNARPPRYLSVCWIQTMLVLLPTNQSFWYVLLILRNLIKRLCVHCVHRPRLHSFHFYFFCFHHSAPTLLFLPVCFSSAESRWSFCTYCVRRPHCYGKMVREKKKEADQSSSLHYYNPFWKDALPSPSPSPSPNTPVGLE